MLTPYRRKTHPSRVSLAREFRELKRYADSIADDLMVMGLRLRFLERANGLDPDERIKTARELHKEMLRRAR